MDSRSMRGFIAGFRRMDVHIHVCTLLQYETDSYTAVVQAVHEKRLPHGGSNHIVSPLLVFYVVVGEEAEGKDVKEGVVVVIDQPAVEEDVYRYRPTPYDTT